MKKLIAAIATVFIAVALSVVAVAGPASAHTASLSGSVSCNSTDGSASVTWTVTNNYAEQVRISASNNSNITVGTVLASGPGTTATFHQTIPAPAAGQNVSATLSFEWTKDNFASVEYTQTGVSFTTQRVSRDCTAKDASAAVVDTAAICGAPESVVVGDISGADWGASGVSGGVFTATATAKGGHSFASASAGGTLNGTKTVETFHIVLNGALSPTSATCAVAAAAVTTTAATCQAPEIVQEGAVTHAGWTSINFNGGTYTAIATADSGYTFPSAANVTSNNTVLTLTGPVAGEVTGHPCEDFIIVAWTMPYWINSTTPSWTPHQTYFTSQEESTPDLSALDSKLVEQCGTQYQVDIYYNSPTTSSLLSQPYLYGPNNPPEDLIPGGWGTAYKLVQGPACAPVTTPKESDVCTDGGTITVYQTAGVQYYLNGTPVNTDNGDVVFTGLQGTNTVTATPLSGYLLTGYPANGWSYDVNSACTATYNSSGECTATDTTSQETVTLNFVNTSGTDAHFVVTSTDSTVTPSGDYLVPANTTVQRVVGTTTDAGGTFNVSVNGATPIAVHVDSFTGCIPVIPGDPTFTKLSCTGSTTNLGSISTDGNENLIYTLNGPGETNVVFPGLPTPTISGLHDGTYEVTVVAKDGFVLTGLDTFKGEVILGAVNCVGTEQTPVVSFVAPTCEPNPENIQDTQKTSEFSAALTEIRGVITIPDNPNMTFTIFDGTSTNPISAGDNIEEDGTYTIVATLTDTAIADGFTFGHSADYTRSVHDTVATFANIVFTSACGLPTLASWHSGATGSPATCTPTGGASGVISLVHGSDAADPTDENGKVTYTLVNNGNGHTTDLGSTALTVNVGPGSYTVEATPTDPADGLVGNTNVANEIDYPVTVAAAAGACGGLLAFTGGTIAWAGFVLAGGMLFLGIAFMLIRRRANRTAQ